MTITLPVLMFLVFVIALAIQVLNLLFERHRKGKSKMKYLINDVKAKKLTEEIDVLDRLKEKNKRELEKIKLEAKQIVDKEGEDVDNQETTTS